MTTTHVSQAVSRVLPQGLRTAHAAIQLPEVVEDQHGVVMKTSVIEVRDMSVLSSHGGRTDWG